MKITIKHIVSAWKLPIRVGITPIVVPMPEFEPINRDWVKLLIWGQR